MAPDEYKFYYLKVPAGFLLERLKDFHIVDDKLSIYLSADARRLFVEERGTGNLDFSVFAVK